MNILNRIQAFFLCFIVQVEFSPFNPQTFPCTPPIPISDPRSYPLCLCPCFILVLCTCFLMTLPLLSPLTLLPPLWLLSVCYLFQCLWLYIFFNFYCYSITVVCLFSPSLHPTPAEPTSLPHLYPPP